MGSRPGTGAGEGALAAVGSAANMAGGSRVASPAGSVPQHPASPQPMSAPGSRPPSQPQPPSSAGARPMSREGPGVGAAEFATAVAAGKAAAAEQAGYAVPGVRFIDVEVVQGPGLPNKMVRVLLDYNQQDHKPYYGGFRNKRTGAVYHHAVTQTPKAPKYAGAEPKLERQTQTVQVSTRTAQTQREAGTQMERPGVVIDTTYDVVRTPGR